MEVYAADTLMYKGLFQLASTVQVEAIDSHSLALYNDKLSRTQIIDASFHWLIQLLEVPTYFADIKKSFSRIYAETPPDGIAKQVDELLATFMQNQLIHKVT